MADKNFVFGGFDKQQDDNEGSFHKEKDFPPRPLPVPLETKASPLWSIDIEEKPQKNINNGIIGIVNLLLPIIGLTILIGGIIGVSVFVFNIYN